MFGRSGRGLVVGVLIALLALAGMGLDGDADRLDLPRTDPTTAGEALVEAGDDHVVPGRTAGGHQRHVVRTGLVVVVAAAALAMARRPEAGWWWRRRDHRWAPAPLSGSPAAALRGPPA